MIALVRFRTSTGDYAVPVESAREVRPAVGFTELPSPARDVVGVLHLADGPITVLRALGDGREHVLVLESAGRLFGLLVEVVQGVVRVDESAVGDPPPGQDRRLVRGVVTLGGDLVLVADVEALAERLDT